MATSKFQAMWNHPAGPQTNFSKPPDKVSYPQQIVVSTNGFIWSRMAEAANYNQCIVSIAMAATGLYQLGRKVKHDYF
ncbi:mitochondrial pyruvate carrier 4-like isoform X2 [Impatiens glandulifera]|uniref:mitochondrial pyruvate carrier 4-like isoform X2 n=1 Tax=Impatiens glandulifera TaxID=253017 RepID=UPI001FB0DF40|nr:mitochondrial pyruvate carrier 4-like isoform X2 [Impatiens glandulifera]